MNKLFLFALLLFFLPPLQAQEHRRGDEAEFGGDCSIPTAEEWIDVNNFQTTFSSGAALSGRPFEVVPYDAPTSAGLLSGLWIGGFDAGGNIKLAATEFDGYTDFFNGPLLDDYGITDDSICTVFDKIWIIHRSDVEAMQQDFADNGELDLPVPEDIRTWPGVQNPDFEAAYGMAIPTAELAPYFDYNGDGLYKVEDGDYPLIKGDVAYWKVINDAGGIHQTSNSFALQVEIQVMAYGYYDEEPTLPVLNRTLFYEINLVSKDIEINDSLFIGLWSDPDLQGYVCGYDYIGTAVDQNMVYSYTTIDPASACGAGNFENFIVGMKLLQGPTQINAQGQEEELKMTNSMAYNNPSAGNPIPATTDPFYDNEFYHLLNSHWKDGEPLTEGGSGYGGTTPTPFVHPGLPNDPDGWSTCTSGETDLDKR
ncbi:MAG: hypothetical protein KDC44_18405, partial [Phaeodactylibacter sp.]|nr:hypothetical protein [Phaeodactylibacter sp.]